MAEYGTRSYYDGRNGSLKLDRNSGWLDHWRDISEFTAPRTSRFLVTESNKGGKKNYRILDPTAMLALRTLSSGMLVGLTSPAKQWFKLRTPDPDLNEFRAVKVWLDIVSNRMREIFLRSNLYTTLPMVYSDLGAYGTSAFAVLSDYEDLLRCYHFPIGSYCLATSSRNVVDVCYREFQMTVRQLVQEFGIENCSPAVKAAYDQKSGAGLETWVTVLHAVEPNPKWDPRREKFSAYKRYHSCYLESGAAGDKKLRESGFDKFRILGPRWLVTGEDAYGSSPVMDVHNDNRSLQHQQKRKQTLIDKGIMPPLSAPTSAKNGRVTQLPGDVTFYDQGTAGQKIEALIDVTRFPYQWLLQDIQETQQRIRRGLFEDLFLMFGSDPRNERPTAREVAEKHEEKLLALGPVVERQNDDMLDPLIDIAFDEMALAGALPEIPAELNGMELGVEYISILAQAMKMVGVQSIERGTAFIGGLAQMRPEAADMINTYELVSDYWESVGAPPTNIHDRKTFDSIQQEKQRQQQQAAMAASVQPMVDSAKTLSETNVTDENALTRISQAIQGAQQAQ